MFATALTLPDTLPRRRATAHTEGLSSPQRKHSAAAMSYVVPIRSPPPPRPRAGTCKGRGKKAGKGQTTTAAAKQDQSSTSAAQPFQRASVVGPGRADIAPNIIDTHFEPSSLELNGIL